MIQESFSYAHTLADEEHGNAGVYAGDLSLLVAHMLGQADLGAGAAVLKIVVQLLTKIALFLNTKHLVGTNGEAPEFYKYWED